MTPRDPLSMLGLCGLLISAGVFKYITVTPPGHGSASAVLLMGLSFCGGIVLLTVSGLSFVNRKHRVNHGK